MIPGLRENLYQEYYSLFHAEARDPHQLLGICENEGQKWVRLWRPGKQEASIYLFGEKKSCSQIHAGGLFEYPLPLEATALDYQIELPNGGLAHDPYAFDPSFGEFDQHLFNEGNHYQLYEVMGARQISHQGALGIRFVVWAPSAKSVSVVGDFNGWNGYLYPMRYLGHPGVWELFIPGLGLGECYQFQIKSAKGELLTKIDPYALQSALRPEVESVVSDYSQFVWSDQEWMEKRVHRSFEDQPMNIYEVHLGSWKKGKDRFPNYKDLAGQLVSYCKEMGFTHVELLPVSEHPLDESWGYQVTGYYSPTSRYGSVADFQSLVNTLHEAGIGVILDWVPAHFPTDEHSLGLFDGTPLYEHEDPKQGFHPHWYTHIFHFGRPQVYNFLIANAIYWLKEMHVDALRVDAVASMLYLDYGRGYGEWAPNVHGNNVNLEAVEFFQHLNQVVHERVPGALMIAEESTTFPGITAPVKEGGLGFDLKWNMGWMNDTLTFFSKPHDERKNYFRHLTFGLVYAFTEKFISVFSHDEVVHEKKSLLSKMPGNEREQFANLRLLYSYMMTQPGKKLLFMGGELGQPTEWDCKKEIPWSLLEQPLHAGVHQMVKELNHLYLSRPELFEQDTTSRGFDWVDFSDLDNCVISYIRSSEEGSKMLVVHHFREGSHPEYLLPLEGVTHIEELFSTDEVQYGGTGVKRPAPVIEKNEGKTYVQMAIPPLSTLLFNVN